MEGKVTGPFTSAPVRPRSALSLDASPHPQRMTQLTGLSTHGGSGCMAPQGWKRSLWGQSSAEPETEVCREAGAAGLTMTGP